MAGVLYEFEWDPLKARANFTKHGVHFDRATQVFRDSLALTMLDEDDIDLEVRYRLDGRLTTKRVPMRKINESRI